MKSIKLVIAALLGTLLLSACSQDPAQIHYGSDECAHCKMMITDERFAAQLVTEKGKAIKFDAVECLVSYYQDQEEALENPKLWVSNFEGPGEWMPAPEAEYVYSDVIQSPMGGSLLALPAGKAKEHILQRPGQVMGWDELNQTDLMDHMR